MIDLLRDPTVFFFVIGLGLIAFGFVINYISAWVDNKAPQNDRYTPERSINNINERYNKNRWS